jgi:hypothetical protein
LREGVFTSETVLLIKCQTDYGEVSPTENGDDGGGEVPWGAAGGSRRGLGSLWGLPGLRYERALQKAEGNGGGKPKAWNCFY